MNAVRGLIAFPFLAVGALVLSLGILIAGRANMSVDETSADLIEE